MTRWAIIHPSLMVASLALASLILFWPADEPSIVDQLGEDRYAGREHEILDAGAIGSAPIVLDDGALVQPVVATAAAVPQLVGLIDGGAYLKSAASGDVKTIGIGEEIDGWTLRRIGARTVRLEQGQRIETLRLFPPVSTRAPATPSAAATAPTASPPGQDLPPD